MGKKINVLQINKSTEYGGVSSMLFNIYQHIDRNRYRFDFLSPNKTSFELKREEIEKMGGKLFGLRIANKKKAIEYFEIYFSLKNFLKNHKYSIIHINSGSKVYNAIVAVCCKRNTSAKIIVHSHNGLINDSIKSKIARKIIEKNADQKLSCSDVASRAMFEKSNEAVMINNGIDYDRFRFDKNKRIQVRKEFGIANSEVLIGNIGRMTTQKNQFFLLEAFKKAKKNNPNLKLLIVGSGELKEKIDNKILELKLSDDVIIVNNRNDMPSIYSALDVFVLPSLYEGLPVSAIESQINGLPTLLSDTITKQTEICDNVQFIGIDRVEKWAETMCNAKRKPFHSNGNNFDIKQTAKKIETIYDNLLKK